MSDKMGIGKLVELIHAIILNIFRGLYGYAVL